MGNENLTEKERNEGKEKKISRQKKKRELSFSAPLSPSDSSGWAVGCRGESLRCGAASSDRAGTALQPGHLSLRQSPFGAASSRRSPHLPKCPRTHPWGAVTSPFGHSDGREKPFGAVKKSPFGRPNPARGGGGGMEDLGGVGGERRCGATEVLLHSQRRSGRAPLRSSAPLSAPSAPRRSEPCLRYKHPCISFIW